MCYHEFGHDFEQLGTELFFKAYPVRREDFEKIQEKFQIKKHIFLRLMPSRRFTLEDVTNRL